MIFITLQIIAINFYSNSTAYTRAKMLSATNYLAGGVYRQFAKVNDYIDLRTENDALVEEIARLYNEMAEYQAAKPDSVNMASGLPDEAARCVVMPASVITNTITRPRNFFTIDKGRQHGIEPEMAIITPQGNIAGYVMECGERNSVAISVLNTEFRTSGRIKNTDYLGSILWNGRNPDYVTLSEIQRYARISIGDTVITDYSSRFPRNLIIGTVEDYQMTDAGYFNVKVRLAARLSGLHKVLLVRYQDMEERLKMEEYTPENPLR